MISALSRRLRVRDDGAGESREKDCTLAEFKTEAAIVILGDPGMGKTTLFRGASKGNYKTVRNFLIEQPAAVGEPLFLDALDEYRSLASGKDASAEVAKSLCSLEKPKFRLSCRSADWFGSMDQDAFRTASASGRVVVLELCPLTREEILTAVIEVVPDPVVFIGEAEAAGLGKLLGNPQTLELLARAWGTEKKPRNKFEAYEIGVSELLKEMNESHIKRGETSVDPCSLRRAAGAGASTLLLSNSVGISRSETADGNGFFNLSVVPHPKRTNLDAVVNRRIFISAEVDRFEFVHRTIAEFLAAEDLSRRITDGLPTDRVMALICGIDGKPVSSLRGLFAWLICRLGAQARGYVERDPYGIVTYSDANVLPPNAQCEVWYALRQLRDPWFLTNDDDRGTFRGLANLSTVKIICELLQDQEAEDHLKIAALEAVANSTEITGLGQIIRNMVLEKHGNTWLRSTALRAFANTVQNNWEHMEALDSELSQAINDLAAPEVRVDLLNLTRECGNLAHRLLSIMKQAASAKEQRRTLGRFYSIIRLPRDIDLDGLLDGASEVFADGHDDCYEFSVIFDEWLHRRLEHSEPITPGQLSKWLQTIRSGRERRNDKAIASLKKRFEQEPALFERVFRELSDAVPNKERSFWLFLVEDLWHLLPREVWPISIYEFFLKCTEKESNPEKAVDFFRMYLNYFPIEGASVALAEASLELMEQRPDVATALGDWRSCKIQKWQKEHSKRREKQRRKQLASHAGNIAYLSPRLTTIREGTEEGILGWAAGVYMGFSYDIKEISGARNRLVSVTNDEIADAVIQGFIKYAENPNLPPKDLIIASWIEGKIPYSHTLLSLSVFLRHSVMMSVPQEALPSCIAAFATAFHAGDQVPGYDDTRTAWIIHQACHNPAAMTAVLKELWILGATKKQGIMPAFHELRQDPSSWLFLTSVSADVLKADINESCYAVRELVSVLLSNDHQAAISIGENELDRKELSNEVRAIWATALFVIDSIKYSDPWRRLMSQDDAALWESIEVLRGDRHGNRGAVNLNPAQRADVIRTLGKRFENVGRPSSRSGSQNPWDASDFITNQIRLLAADSSLDTGVQFERLEKDAELASYHHWIRHHRAQYEKQRRESSFEFASPEAVAEAIRPGAPATPSDLLVFIVDHLVLLGRELTQTQTERYRAYWNESGRDLLEPKWEEACSGFLADDLQNRIRLQGLIVTVEHHMVKDKECDLVVLQGAERLLPIEVKHHYNRELWTAWQTQLDCLYTRDAKAGGLGIYLVLWSGKKGGRRMPKISKDLKRPKSATDLCKAIESIIPEKDRHRLRVVVIDISGPS